MPDMTGTCLKARADHDAVVPWLHKHNIEFLDMIDVDADTTRWLLACSCGEFVEFDRLLSRLTRAYDMHSGHEAVVPLSIGKLTVEV